MRPREGIFIRIYRGGFVALSVELYEELGSPQFLGAQLKNEVLEIWPAQQDSFERVKVNLGRKLKNGSSIRQFHSRRLSRIKPGRYEVRNIEDWAEIPVKIK
ncbi:hypothetical protein DRH29_03295 [candidate division Kazan bacterium]|uniref:Uncharacterized protein n=1 Tax=candidate division Kazan bacterium TaxID=2202143 RepID=A0A420ZCC6_UNCK3|nr:MAG: hypothetical protein DRH29_03295 [candidate division Kazan bacterium]